MSRVRRREVRKAWAAKMAINIITMWPALILAARRNERVIDRTDTLVDSTRTKNGFSHEGAPPGRSIAMNFMGKERIEDKMRLSHRVHPNEKVNRRWLVILKM